MESLCVRRPSCHVSQQPLRVSSPNLVKTCLLATPLEVFLIFLIFRFLAQLVTLRPSSVRPWTQFTVKRLHISWWTFEYAFWCTPLDGFFIFRNFTFYDFMTNFLNGFLAQLVCNTGWGYKITWRPSYSLSSVVVVSVVVVCHTGYSLNRQCFLCGILSQCALWWYLQTIFFFFQNFQI